MTRISELAATRAADGLPLPVARLDLDVDEALRGVRLVGRFAWFGGAAGLPGAERQLRTTAVAGPWLYRYALGRLVNPLTAPPTCADSMHFLKTLLVIGVNPSSADHQTDDPTVRQCLGFARRWKMGRLWMANLFAFRSTDPTKLLTAADPFGEANDAVVMGLAARADMILCAWGTAGWFKEQHQVRRWKLIDAGFGDKIRVLDTTAHGYPRHPLRTPLELQPRRWEPDPAEVRAECARAGHLLVEERRAAPVTEFEVCRRCGKIGERLPPSAP